jgi:hypothetical protein
MEQVDIKTKTIGELKIMAYDTIAIMEAAQRNLKALNQEIAERAAEPQKA